MRAQTANVWTIARLFLIGLSAVSYGARAQSPAQNKETVLGKITVEGAALETEDTGSYKSDASGILKGAQSLKDIPQSVTVITRQQLDDQAITDVGMALSRAPGIFKFDRQSYVSDKDSIGAFYSRGYEIDSYMVDGVPRNARNANGYGSMFTGSAAVYDRIEVLRGAAGLLVGQGSPGGTVNLVRKLPTADFRQRYTVSAGSWNNYRAEIDLSGPLTSSGGLRGRVVGAYEDRDRFWDLTNSRSPLAYGVLEQDIGDNTSVRLGGRYERYKEEAPESRQFIAGYVPARTRLYSADWGYREVEESEIFLDVNHAFNDRWFGTLAASHRNYDGEQLLIGMGSAASGRLNLRENRPETDGLDAYLSGAFDAFGREHRVTLGFNLGREDNKGINAGLTLPVTFAPDAFDPYTSFPYDAAMAARVAELEARPRTAIETRSEGVYGKVDFKLADALTLLVGARGSWYQYKSYLDDGTPNVLLDDSVDGKVTPYAGLIYALSPHWSAYASYADIFQPQFGNWKRNGEVADDLLGKNYELGIKGESADGRLNTSLALYRVELKNTLLTEVPPFDLACPGNPTGEGCVVPAGLNRTEGVDVEASGEILPRWQIAFGYTYTRTEIVKADADVGAAFNYTPKHMAKLWTSYNLPDRWSDFTFGGGVRAQSREEYGDYAYLLDFGFDASSLAQGGYAVFDLFGRYQADRWELALNVNNVLDRTYYPNGATLFKHTYGTPRNVMMTLRVNL